MYFLLNMGMSFQPAMVVLEKTIILVGIDDKQFQGTIILMA